MFRVPALSLFVVLVAMLSAPCRAADGWLEDEINGCKVWTRNIEPGDSVIWNGECQHGYAEGRGTYEFRSHGKMTWKGEADFKAGRREGRGLSQSADGVKIEGEYQDGVLNGRVIETDSRIGRYVGTYRNGDRNGLGRFTYANGDYYDGLFANGLPNGRGVFLGHNAAGGVTTYDGVWRDGCFNDGKRRIAVLVTPKDCGFE
ncbi:MAG: hypothetical protein JSR90_23000 [Proteobacteria bacterium]|nr:hypothetical protein [Pseudomonadota bacterium]